MNLTKFVVDRARPDVDRLTGFSGSSFPSGHATTAAATFAAIALLVGRGRSAAREGLAGRRGRRDRGRGRDLAGAARRALVHRRARRTRDGLGVVRARARSRSAAACCASGGRPRWPRRSARSSTRRRDGSRPTMPWRVRPERRRSRRRASSGGARADGVRRRRDHAASGVPRSATGPPASRRRTDRSPSGGCTTRGRRRACCGGSR